MHLSPTLSLKQKPLLAMTPEMLQAIGLLQMTALELNRFVEEQGQKNPFLKVTLSSAAQSAPVASSSTFSRHTSAGSEIRHTEQLTAQKTLLEHIVEQLGYHRLTTLERRIAFAFIEGLEPSGWLGTSVEKGSLRTKVAPAKCAAVLEKLQTFEPAGLFARDLAECLRLQLVGDDEVLMTIINNLSEFADSGPEKFASAQGIQRQDLEDAMRRLRVLDPKPGSAFVSDHLSLIVPDIIVEKKKLGWAVSLNNSALPTVEIDKKLFGLLERSDADADSVDEFRKHFGTAKWIIHAIQRRQETLLRIGSALVGYQADFLELGRDSLRPLRQKDIAIRLNVSESTVSRVVNAGYVQTPTTVISLRDFFCTSIDRDKGQPAVSTVQIQRCIKELVDIENPQKPLSDNSIATALQQDGIAIARRTIAKYRNMANIPSRSKRRVRLS